MSDFTDPLEKKIVRLSEDLAKVREQQARADAQQDERVEQRVFQAEMRLNMAQQDRLLIRMDTAINGNGRPGLKDRMSDAESKIKVVWALLIAVVGAVATAGAAAYLHTHPEPPMDHSQVQHDGGALASR